MGSKRKPDETRRRLLEAAYEEIHRVGFQAASLSRILQNSGVTKGALYHHFPSKKALGYAVVEEVIKGLLESRWTMPITQAEDPIDGLVQVLHDREAEVGERVVRLGCP